MSESWGCATPGAFLLGLIALIAAAVIAVGAPSDSTSPSPRPSPTVERHALAIPSLAGCIPGHPNCKGPLFRGP